MAARVSVVAGHTLSGIKLFGAGSGFPNTIVGALIEYYEVAQKNGFYL